jgi:hypothetical protein
VYVLKCRCTCNRARCSGGSPALCAIPWAPSHALHEKGEREREREGEREREREIEIERKRGRKRKVKEWRKRTRHMLETKTKPRKEVIHMITALIAIPPPYTIPPHQALSRTTHRTTHSTPLHATKPYPTPPHLISASLTALQIHPLLFDHGPWTRIRN